MLSAHRAAMIVYMILGDSVKEYCTLVSECERGRECKRLYLGVIARE